MAKANSSAEETISAMKTVRSFANEEVEANIYRDKLQRVYELNKKEASAYTYYVWSNGVSSKASSCLQSSFTLQAVSGRPLAAESIDSASLVSAIHSGGTTAQ